MITQSEMFPMLVEASPSFQACIEDHVESCEEIIPYVLLGQFAHHLLRLHQEKATEEFPAIAEVIERLHKEGDDYVKEAATIGILEGIQNTWGNSGVNPELFGTYLLPESRKWWDELNAFWQGKRRFIGEGIQSEFHMQGDTK